MNNSVQKKLNERGQSMIELALTITILMVLLAGTIDLGRAFFTWLALRDAAQEGASYGAIYADNASLESLVSDRVWDNLEQVVADPPNDTDVTVTIITQPCLGNTIVVDVDYPHFPITMPFLGFVLGKQELSIHATVNDTILNPICH